MFTNDPGDWGSIPGHVIPKTLKMVLDTSLFNTQQYKVCIKGKVEQSQERSSVLPLHLGVVAVEKGAFWSPSTTVTNFTYLLDAFAKILNVTNHTRLWYAELTWYFPNITCWICLFAWFGWVLWHINCRWLFNAKFRFYIYIYIWFVNSFYRYIFKSTWPHSFVHS